MSGQADAVRPTCSGCGWPAAHETVCSRCTTCGWFVREAELCPLCGGRVCATPVLFVQQGGGGVSVRREAVAAAAVWALTAALAVGAAWWWMELPTVRRAYPSEECRAVEPAGDCRDVPKHHRLVWVHESWRER